MTKHNIKADFPFFSNNKDAVWLDSSATTQKPKCVTEAISSFYDVSNSNVSRGEYPLADNATRLFEESRATVAKWFGTAPERIVFTSGATDSLALAAYTVGRALAPGDNLVVSTLEHNSSLLPWMKLSKERGADLRFIPLKKDGALDLSFLPSLTDEKTKAAVVTAGSNVSGYRAPLDEISDFFAEAGVPLIIDAAQAAAHQRFYAGKLRFEYICLSAHKLYGPMGLGVLIAGSDKAADATERPGGGTVISVTKEGYTKKSGIAGAEAGTPDVAGAYAFGKALNYLSSLETDAHFKEEDRLAKRLRQELAKLGMRIVPGGDDPFPVVSFDPVFIHPLDAARLLGATGICVRCGKHCAHLAHDALGFDTTLRASFGIYNDESDVERLVEALRYLKGRYGDV